MSTKARIGILENGTYTHVYCHNEGYPTFTGKILEQTYNTSDKIQELLNLGRMSMLGNKLEPDPNLPHNDETSQKDVVQAYHRDWGRPYKQPLKSAFDSEYDIHQFLLETTVEYVYVFDTTDSTWYVYRNFTDDPTYRYTVDEIIAKEKSLVEQEDKESSSPQYIPRQIGRIKPQSEVYVTFDAGKGDIDGIPFDALSVHGNGSYIISFPTLKTQVIYDAKALINDALDIALANQQKKSTS